MRQGFTARRPVFVPSVRGLREPIHGPSQHVMRSCPHRAQNHFCFRSRPGAPQTGHVTRSSGDPGAPPGLGVPSRGASTGEAGVSPGAP
ncbi:MAG: hypothetical protein HY721_03215 [Planctomycetes bacterium]|nr:hypothetical protein [Planctomycetota bacterium]